VIASAPSSVSSVPDAGAGWAARGAAPAGSGARPPPAAPAADGLAAAREAAARGAGEALAGTSGRPWPATPPAPLAPPATGDGARGARPAPSGAPGGRPATGAAAALDALRRVDAARARLDAVLAEARRGRSFSAAELLCLQADAHRFAQTVEIVARAAEHGVQGVKQAVHLQV
jgi:hypothetical protein